MAIHQHHQQQTGHPQNQPLLQFDALYCEEEEEEEEEEPQWEEEDHIGVVELGGGGGAEACANIHNNNINSNNNNNNNGGTGAAEETDDNAPFLPLLLLSEQELLWDDEEELVSLFSKEHEQIHPNGNGNGNGNGGPYMDPALILVRKEAVEWMLKVVAFYGFTALTSILAINYLDRFLCSVHFQREKPWMVQLSAVTCLSLAAKVEETQVPLLLDLQVEDTTSTTQTQYMFEAKTIQRMELVVLSALEWRMNLVTPLSFLGHIVRRLRYLKKTRLQWEFEFLRRCERLIVSVVADWRSVCFVPSVLATAAMLHVVNVMHQQQQQKGGPNLNAIDYQTQLLRLLNMTREEEEEEEEVEKVNDCCQLIMEVVSSRSMKEMNKKKRKCKCMYGEDEGNPESPNGVIDYLSFSYEYDDTNDESWAMAMVGGGPSVSSSFKKIRTPPHF